MRELWETSNNTQDGTDESDGIEPCNAFLLTSKKRILAASSK